MPHLHIKEFKEIKLPQKVDGISYDFIAKNIKKSDEVMISVSIDSEENATSFFLVLRINEDKILLKSDKLTRPASVYSVHKAMLSYAKLAQLEILSSNVPQKPKNIHLEELTALKTIEFFTTHFPTNKEINIEVGFGSGRHLIHQALQNPDILFVGIEIHRPSIEQVLKQISIQNIQNIYLLDYDARLFMELIPSNVVGKIFVHFPVPWDKKPHRRVISTSFIQEARRVLKVEGRLELRTDSENYYSYSYETFIAFHKTILHINKNRDIAISSKYEDRWKKMQKNIYDVTMINEESSKPLSIEGDFEFSPKRLNEQELISLNGSTQRFDGGFVHFERVYSLDDGIMFRISMGSFDRPEHLFVILKETSITYHPSLPLKSKSNLVAHKFLEGVF